MTICSAQYFLGIENVTTVASHLPSETFNSSSICSLHIQSILQSNRLIYNSQIITTIRNLPEQWQARCARAILCTIIIDRTVIARRAQFLAHHLIALFAATLWIRWWVRVWAWCVCIQLLCISFHQRAAAFPLARIECRLMAGSFGTDTLIAPTRSIRVIIKL